MGPADGFSFGIFVSEKEAVPFIEAIVELKVYCYGFGPFALPGSKQGRISL
jgi:hypothetical protein